MDIETVAKEDPDAIIKEPIDIHKGGSGKRDRETERRRESHAGAWHSGERETGTERDLAAPSLPFLFDLATLFTP